VFILIAFQLSLGRSKNHKTWREEPIGKPRCKWKNNSEIDPKEVGYQLAEWIHLAEDRDQWWALVTTVMNLWFPW